MNNKNLSKIFGSDENQKMLFSVLTDSNISLDNEDIMECIEKVYNKLNEFILTNTKHITLIEINKKFIKDVIYQTKTYYSNNFYQNKVDRRNEKRMKVEKRMNEHQKNFESFNKKLPEQIDFTEKNWLDKDNVTDKIDIKIKEREEDLEKITNNYQKVESDDDFQNHSIWFKKKKKENKIKKNIKITNEKVKIDAVEIKREKHVHFEDEDQVWKKKIEYLEKEVAEVKRLIREVLSEKLMKNTTS